jgi:protein gp37
MGTETGIEWTDHTFNPWLGCTKVSDGCKNCYAAARDARHLSGPVDHWGPGAPRQTMGEGYWSQPERWAERARQAGKRAKVFTASMADIFDAEAPVADRRALWKIIQKTCGWLDWQIVTKRPQNIKTVIVEDRLDPAFFALHGCWLLTSTEHQDALDERWPHLAHVPAAVHGISAEPLLGPLNLLRALTTYQRFEHWPHPAKLRWVICGGESGPGARHMSPDWARRLRQQCEFGEVPFFFKQWGEWLPPRTTGSYNLNGSLEVNATDEFVKVGKQRAGALLDGIKIQQFPAVM